MKVLVFTQAVDKNDPVLGFFHNWLIEFSSKFDEITVIALRVGEMELPANIKVYSLGKEKRRSKISTIARLFVLIWRGRHSGDAVFVHMNKEYILAGWLIWKISGVPVYLWYNHRYANWFARLAMRLSKKVFYTSEHSAGAKWSNSVSMPVGVDTDLFNIYTPVSMRGNTMLSLGRIDPVKNVDIIAKSILSLSSNTPVNFKATIAGSPSWGNEKYAASIRESLKPLTDKGTVHFAGGVLYEKTVELFNQNKIFINLTSSGSFDKTILEAMASGCLVVVANQSVFDVLNDEGKVLDINTAEVSSQIVKSFLISKVDEEKIIAKMRKFVVEKHSLKLLAERLAFEVKA